MFESLDEPKVDAILALMTAFRADPRSEKLDLGVGVYKDANGKTPVMRSIKRAEKALHESQETKAYVGPAGSPSFAAAMIAQVFGDSIPDSRVRAIQSVGGSGALRILADMLRATRPDATVWVSDPSWPNHLPLLGAAGFSIERYPYFNRTTGSVDIDAMLATLGTAREGDIVVLHGCCHNPTGADLNKEQWRKVVELLKRRNLFPFVDLAYQGFGDGLNEDAWATRLIAGEVDEAVVAASCSKNFGLYRDRVGAAMIIAANEEQAVRAQGLLSSTVRANYSMPPDHGAATTERVLSDPELSAEWREELESMRVRMIGLREAFSEAMRKRSNSDRFDFIASQKGMFSRLPLDKPQIDRLRDEFGIYMVGDGRINIAGLPEDGLDALADAICTVID